jgi:hypothetical protein
MYMEMHEAGLAHKMRLLELDLEEMGWKKLEGEDQYLEEELSDRRKKLMCATDAYGDFNSDECTPWKRRRVFDAKIKELEARIQLADCEAAHLSSLIDVLERKTPKETDMIANLIKKMREKRNSSAQHIQISLALRPERETFLESTANSDAATRTRLMKALLGMAKQKRSTGEGTFKDGVWLKGSVEDIAWRNLLHGAYDTAGPNSKTRWCPVGRCYHLWNRLKTVPIVPHSLGPELMSYLTGTDMTSTLLVGNGLLLPFKLGEQLNRGGVALVPVNGTDDPIELRVVVVDQSIRPKSIYRYGGAKKFGDVDGQVLGFKTSVRPQKRLLYVRYAMTILRAWRLKMPGYEALRSTWPAHLVWTHPGAFIRKSPLRIAGILGQHLDQTFDGCFPDMSERFDDQFQAEVDAMPEYNDDVDGK